MKFFKALILGISLTLAGMTPSFGWTFEASQEQVSSNVKPSWNEVLNYAQENLPMEGQLIIKSDGFGYLKVDDNYIHTLFPMLGLKKEGF